MIFMYAICLIHWWW